MAVLHYIAALALAFVIVTSATAAAEHYEALMAYETASAKTDTLLKDVLEGLSFGYYKGARAKNDAREAIAAAAARHEARARHYGWGLLALSTVFLGVKWALWRRAHTPVPAALIGHLLGVSAVFLMVGLSAPILTLSAHKEVAVLGKVVLQYESKGILTTVARLADTGNYFLAGLLFLFSVVNPAVKLVISFVALAARRPAVRRATIRTISVIGKWSMTDVFVVAVLLAFFAGRADTLTDASLGTGLYFFAGFGVLSLAAGHLMVVYGDELMEEAARRTARTAAAQQPESGP